MTFLRRNLMNVLLFILWLGMTATLTSARADVQGGASGEGYSIDLACHTFFDAGMPSGLPVAD